MNMINKKYELLFFGIFSFVLISLVYETANAIDENNDELIESAMNFIKMDRIDKAIPILEEVLEKEAYRFKNFVENYVQTLNSKI